MLYVYFDQLSISSYKFILKLNTINDSYKHKEKIPISIMEFSFAPNLFLANCYHKMGCDKKQNVHLWPGIHIIL